MPPLALITDCSGPKLDEAEREWLRTVQPFGFILFARHCETPQQVKGLIADLQGCVDHPAPVFIDQEGGRVARLKPPHWDRYPPAAAFAALWRVQPEQAVRACYLNARLLGAELAALGITANCAPLADIPVPGAHDVIGDRAFGNAPEPVIALARAQADGLLDAGVLPVLKHIPGHGRATADSHEALPVVNTPLEELARTDFLPFQALRSLPFAMTAHIRYTALDAERPATLSPAVITYIRHQIGFRGLLMSDDLSMKALCGPLPPDALAAQTLEAGCDLVLHCNGTPEERRLVADGCLPMPAARYDLYLRALDAISGTEPCDSTAFRMQRDALLKGGAA